MEAGKKGLCIIFWRVYGEKKSFLGASYSTSNKLLHVARHILTLGLLKIGSVKFANLLSLPSIVKKVGTGSKSSQGT